MSGQYRAASALSGSSCEDKTSPGISGDPKTRALLPLVARAIVPRWCTCGAEVVFGDLGGGRLRMTSFIVPAGAGDHAVLDDALLPLATAAYLARFKGLSREHTDSDLRAFLNWCVGRGIEPLQAQRAQLELYVRWMQETRRYKPSTVSRRTSVLSGFYRTAVIDGVLEHSPAEYVRRPTVPPESPTLGLTHLQFEAMLTTARESANRFDFALVAMLGLLGLLSLIHISEPTRRTPISYAVF